MRSPPATTASVSPAPPAAITTTRASSPAFPGGSTLGTASSRYPPAAVAAFGPVPATTVPRTTSLLSSPKRHSTSAGSAHPAFGALTPSAAGPARSYLPPPSSSSARTSPPPPARPMASFRAADDATTAGAMSRTSLLMAPARTSSPLNNNNSARAAQHQQHRELLAPTSTPLSALPVAARAEALEAEVARARSAQAAAEADTLQAARELTQIRVDADRDRLALTQRHLSEVEAERLRVAALEAEQARRHHDDLAARERRAAELTTRISSLEQTLERAHQLAEERNGELQAALRRLSEADVARAELEGAHEVSLRTAAARASALTQQLDAARRDVERGTAALEAAEARAEAARRAGMDMEERAAALEGQNGQLQVDLDAARHEQRQLTIELQRERARGVREAEAATETAARSAEERARHAAEMDAARNDGREKARDLAQAEVDLATALATLGEMRGELERATRTSMQWELRCEAVTVECDKAAKLNAEYEVRLAERNVEVQGLAARVRELTAESDNHAAVAQRYREDLGAARLHAEKLRAQCAEAEHVQKQLEQQAALAERYARELDEAEARAKEAAAALLRAEQRAGQAQELATKLRQVEVEARTKDEFAVTVLARLDATKASLDAATRQGEEMQQALDAKVQELHEAQMQIAAKDEHIHACQRELADKALLESRVHALEGTLSARMREIQQGIEENGELRRQLLEVGQRVSHMGELEVTIRRLQEEKAMLAELSKQQRQEATNMELEGQRTRAQLDELRTHSEELRRDLAAAHATTAELQQRDGERGILRARVDMLEDEARNAAAAYRTLQTQSESLRVDYAAASQQAEQARAAQRDAQERADRLKRQLDDLQVELGRMTVFQDGATRDVSKARLEQEQALARADRSQALADAAEQELRGARARLAEHDAVVESLRADSVRRAKEFDDCVALLTEARRLHADAEDRLTAAAEENSKLRTAYARSTVLEGKVNALERLLEEKDGDIARLELQVRQGQDALTAVNHDITLAERTVRTLEELKQRGAALQDALDQSDQQLAAARLTGVDKDRSIAQLQQQVRDARADAESLQADRARDAATIERLDAETRRLRVVEGEAQGLQQLLAARESELAALREAAATSARAAAEREGDSQRLQRALHECAMHAARAEARDEFVRGLEAELELRGAKCKNLQSQLDAAAHDREEQQRALHLERDAVHAATAENKGLREQVDFLRREHEGETQRRADDLARLQSLTGDARAELKVTVEEAVRLNLQNQRLADDLSRAEETHATTKRQVTARDGELAALRASFEERGAAMQRLSSQLADERARAAAAQDAADKMQLLVAEHGRMGESEAQHHRREVGAIQQCVDELRSRLAARDAVIAEKDATIKQQDAQLTALDTEVRRHRLQSQQLQHDVSALQEDLASLQRTTGAATARRAAAEGTAEQASARLAEQSLRVSELERRHATERATFAEREVQLRREAERATANQQALRTRATDLEMELDTRERQLEMSERRNRELLLGSSDGRALSPVMMSLRSPRGAYASPGGAVAAASAAVPAAATPAPGGKAASGSYTAAGVTATGSPQRGATVMWTPDRRSF